MGNPASSKARRTTSLEDASNRQKHESSSGANVEPMTLIFHATRREVVDRSDRRALASSSSTAVIPGEVLLDHPLLHAADAQADPRRRPTGDIPGVHGLGAGALPGGELRAREWTPELAVDL